MKPALLLFAGLSGKALASKGTAFLKDYDIVTPVDIKFVTKTTTGWSLDIEYDVIVEADNSEWLSMVTVIDTPHPLVEGGIYQAYF